MGEYEELCEQHGLSPGSEEDYDRLLNLMTGEAEGNTAPFRKPRRAALNHLSGEPSEAPDATPQKFDTFSQAKAWAQAHPGCSFTRAVDGIGFQALVPSIHADGEPLASYSQAKAGQALPPLFEYRRGGDHVLGWCAYMDQLGSLSPHLNHILRRSSSNEWECTVLPFSAQRFEAELCILPITHVRRLDLFLVMNIRKDRRELANLEAAIRRNRRMRAGHYGEALSYELIALQERVRPLVQAHLTRRLQAAGDSPGQAA